MFYALILILILIKSAVPKLYHPCFILSHFVNYQTDEMTTAIHDNQEKECKAACGGKLSNPDTEKSTKPSNKVKCAICLK